MLRGLTAFIISTGARRRPWEGVERRALRRRLKSLCHVDGSRSVEARMRLAAHLVKAVGGEETEIAWERDPHTERKRGRAGGARVALGRGEEPARDPAPAELRMYREAAEVEALALAGGEHATDEPPARVGHDDSVVREGRGDRLRGLAECTRFRLELAAVLLEGGSDDCSNLGTLRECGEADRDLVGLCAQMPPVRSGRRSSAM